MGVCCVLSACGVNDFLMKAEEVCVKYPTPDARAECERRNSRTRIEFEKQQAQDKKAQRAAEQDAPSKPNSLCFKRQPTGELVCPN
jgi:hypothetical protein